MSYMVLHPAAVPVKGAGAADASSTECAGGGSCSVQQAECAGLVSCRVAS